MDVTTLAITGTLKTEVELISYGENFLQLKLKR
jgi:hypothetical protein